MKKLLLMIATIMFMLAPADVAAQKKKASKPKTVYVKSYRTKKGKTVKAHYRSKPTKKSKSTKPKRKSTMMFPRGVYQSKLMIA